MARPAVLGYIIFYESALLAASCIAYIARRDFFWKTALCYKCAVFHILGFRYELWKSGV